MVLIPEFTSKNCPLRLNVCFESLVSSVLFDPILPSLKLLHRKILGYAVSSEPSAFNGIVPNVFVTL